MRFRIYILFPAIFVLLFIENGFTQKRFYAPGNENWEQELSEDPTELLYTVYLVGDIKYPNLENKNLDILQKHISLEDSNSALVFLGDLLYPLGLPDSSDKQFDDADRNLNYILEKFKNFTGRLVFLPGNHDWSKSRQQGWESVKNEENFIENYFNNENVFLPDGGCPGPIEIKLSEDLTLIVFDSQWWFHKNEKPGLDGECDFEDEADLFIQVEDAIRRNRDKKVIFATHHPLYSVGKHGGYFPASYLLFPLLEVKNWMVLPLPGFIYTGYRKYLGDLQDLAHPEYKIFKETMLEIFREYPNLIYAAGHEHNLQYFNVEGLHHIVSGGGGEGTYIARKDKKTDFAYQSAGFNKLYFYKNGNVWMEFIIPDSTIVGEVVFRKKLFNKPVFDPVKKEIKLEQLDFSDSIVRVKISDIYTKGKFHRFWMGDNYRNIWNATVELPVFDIGTEKGGLSIIKRGGGQQTRSIRMEDAEGRQYVLRSVNKFVEKALDKTLQNTIAVDAVQDGISASHPFSAITVPLLADAAGVMHTNPKIVWVPDDPRLGIYREEMANGVFLFEERPAGNREDVKSFERSTKIVSTPKVIEKIQDEHDHQVDQLAVVRARLFDMFINDWDRHDDQWRWAKSREGDLKIYRPIPRDRDQVFFLNEGVVMWIARRDWIMPKFQGFDYTIDDVKGLGFNARYFDRSFMTEPSLEQWISTAEDIQSDVTDSIIREAIQNLPENIYQSSGIEIENKLKSRRDLLTEYAAEYYSFLSKGVDVVGTKERELFNIERKENGNTQVSVFALSDKKGKVKEQLYTREFIYGQTKEIRLYGLKGKDLFKLTGQGKKGIKVRIIGGKSNDSIVDESKVRGMGKKTIIYDRKDKKNVFIKGPETRLRLSKKKSINNYDRKQFKYNKNMPLLAAGYNIDDGIFIGAGANMKRYNFRDSTQHKIQGRLAFQTGAFAISYSGYVTSISRVFDFIWEADFSLPRNVDNFYGLGNETKKLTSDKKYHRVRYEFAWANPQLKHTVSKNFNYSFGAFYQYFKVTDTADRFIGDIHDVLLDSSAYASHHYTGITAGYFLDTRDDEILPKRGITWKTEALGYYSIREEGKNFIKIRSDLSFYLSFNRDPRVVFAFRFGGAVNLGDYEFFHANFLGGKTNLRGFRSNRFAGDQVVYQNTEIRFKLMNIRSYIFNGQTGLLLFNDIGRVWVGGENSKRWHDGYGIGLWLTPFDFTALTVAYNHSYDDSLLTFTFKFLF